MSRSTRSTRSVQHHYQFPYVSLHGKSYPLIPLSLKKGNRQVNTFALLDSGASISVFRPEIAKALGIRIKEQRLIRLGTANGGVNIGLAEVQIKIEHTAFKAEIGFSDTYAANFNIIGREGFFHRFSICFNEVMKTVVLVPLRRLRSLRTS